MLPADELMHVCPDYSLLVSLCLSFSLSLLLSLVSVCACVRTGGLACVRLHTCLRRSRGDAHPARSQKTCLEPLEKLLKGCLKLQQLTLTKTLNRRWNNVFQPAVDVLRKTASARSLRIELCSESRPLPLDVACGLCGSVFYKDLDSYYHVPGNQRHITSELCTDVAPMVRCHLLAE